MKAYFAARTFDMGAPFLCGGTGFCGGGSTMR